MKRRWVSLSLLLFVGDIVVVWRAGVSDSSEIWFTCVLVALQASQLRCGLPGMLGVHYHSYDSLRKLASSDSCLS